MTDWAAHIPYRGGAFFTLRLLGEGTFECKSGGWIEVKKKEDGLYAFWTSHKTSHYAIHDTPATSVTYFQAELGSVFQSALNMYPVRKEEERIEVARMLEEKISSAYDNTFKRTQYLSEFIRVA